MTPTVTGPRTLTITTQESHRRSRWLCPFPAPLTITGKPLPPPNRSRPPSRWHRMTRMRAGAVPRIERRRPPGQNRLFARRLGGLGGRRGRSPRRRCPRSATCSSASTFGLLTGESKPGWRLRRVRSRPPAHADPPRHGPRPLQRQAARQAAQTKLTARQQAHLVKEHESGEHSTADLAELFSVTRATVYRVWSAPRAPCTTYRLTGQMPQRHVSAVLRLASKLALAHIPDAVGDLVKRESGWAGGLRAAAVGRMSTSLGGCAGREQLGWRTRARSLRARPWPDGAGSRLIP